MTFQESETLELKEIVVEDIKKEIIAEIFTEWAPAQEDLEDDFEL